MTLNKKIVVIRLPLGLHLRVIAALIARVKKFRSRIWIQKGITMADARSILNVIELAATFGTELNFILDGDDALDALNAIQDFFRQEVNVN